MSTGDFSRRDFIKTAGVASLGLGAIVGAAATAQEPRKIAANDHVQIGVIGTGSRGNHLLQNVLEVPGVKITALCDIQESNLKKGKKYVNDEVWGTNDYRELLARPDVDGVIIAAPLHLHSAMAIDALRAGKDVLVEKTMAYDIPQVLEMRKAVRETGRLLQVGHQRRYSPLYLKVLQMVRNGAIGRVTNIRAQWHRNGDWRRKAKDPQTEELINWRLYREYSGGLVTELATHQIHVVNWLLGEVPDSVVGVGGIDYWKDNRDVYDNINLIYSYPSGVKFTYTSITTNEFYGCNEQIMGTEGTIELSTSGAKIYSEKKVQRTEFETFVMDFERSLLQTVAIGTASFLPEDPTMDMGTDIKAEGMSQSETYYSLEHFVKCVRTREPIWCDVIEGGDAAIAGHLANQSMDEHQIVHWPEAAKTV